MALRDDLIPVVDEVRRTVIDQAVGLRLHAVSVRRRAWSGGELGRGTAANVDTVLDPVPKVNQPEPRLKAAEPGKYEEGDVVVDRISLTYTPEQLGQGAPGSAEVFWLIDGEAYRLVALEERYLQWRAHLRRMRNRA